MTSGWGELIHCTTNFPSCVCCSRQQRSCAVKHGRWGFPDSCGKKIKINPSVPPLKVPHLRSPWFTVTIYMLNSTLSLSCGAAYFNLASFFYSSGFQSWILCGLFFSWIFWIGDFSVLSVLISLDLVYIWNMTILFFFAPFSWLPEFNNLTSFSLHLKWET